MVSLKKDLEVLIFRLKFFNQEFEEILFSFLPAPLLQSKTDADGNFKVMLPYRGKFCVAARASRRIVADT